MPKFTITRGLNARRYYETTIEADTAEQAFASAKALLDDADAWRPSMHGYAPLDDLREPCHGADETLSVTDESGEVSIDFTEIPNADEPACFAALLAFARRVAAMTTPEDEFANDPQHYMDAGELLSDISGDRLMDEYSAFMSLVEEARALVAWPKTGV